MERAIFCIDLCLFETVSLCHRGWSAVARSLFTATSASQVQVILVPQPPMWPGLQVCTTMPGSFFVFLVEMEFHYIDQTGLELLASRDLPVSTSQSAEITGMSHCASPVLHISLVFQMVIS